MRISAEIQVISSMLKIPFSYNSATWKSGCIRQLMVSNYCGSMTDRMVVLLCLGTWQRCSYRGPVLFNKYLFVANKFNIGKHGGMLELVLFLH